MKKKVLTSFVLLLTVVLSLGMFFGCQSTTQSNYKYWFSSYSKNFVKYDEETNNINEAGSHWEMTVKDDVLATIVIVLKDEHTYPDDYQMNIPAPLLKFTLNDTQIGAEPNDIQYTYKNLTLKKGDKIKLHAFWINSLYTTDEGFSIQIFSINTYNVIDL